MSSGPNLRLIVDGDHNRVYRRGDKVTGRVLLVLEEQESIKSLRLFFVGTCVTKTTRPVYVAGNDTESGQSRRPYEERVRLFTFEQILVPECTFAPNKYSWTFEFIFPESTEGRFSRLTHGSKYHRDPHPLPPSFRLNTNIPGGQALVSYYVQARLVHGTAKETKKVNHALAFQPTPRDLPLEPKVASRILYAQTWKPVKDTRKAVNRVFSKVSGRTSSGNNPRIVPTIYHPDKVAPGQHIPLMISLTNTREPFQTCTTGEAQCFVDSFSVTISTYSTAMCGQAVTEPEDVVSKHVTCISRTDMKKPIPFGSPVKLTTNFRLVDDAECVPTFKTYTITRRYTLGITVGLRYEDQTFMLRCTAPLEILPRIPRELLPPVDEEVDVDPLPLYMPREPSKEFAPDYESLYSLSPELSVSNPGSIVLSSRSSSLGSGASLSSAPSTPGSELDIPDLERLSIRNG